MTMQLRRAAVSGIETIRRDRMLYQEKNFYARLQAIDDIEFHIIGSIDALMQNGMEPGEANLLRQAAEKIKHALEAVDSKMFHQLRAKISRGTYRGEKLMHMIDEYFDGHLQVLLQPNGLCYNQLDVFLNGLLTYQTLPVETRAREPGMVYYQKTPATIIIELIKRAAFKPADVFYDLGSGLGQVTILVNLLTGVVSKGIEFEPAYCRYARACAAGLQINGVDFINADARYADYTEGNVFFMYTPFEGRMLQEVLQRLRAGAANRTIKLFTYGPCTETIAKQDWLISKSMAPEGLGEFSNAFL